MIYYHTLDNVRIHARRIHRRLHGKAETGASRLKPLTVKEVEKLTAVRPTSIKHRFLGGVPGFVLVHTPAGYTGYGLIYRCKGERKKLTLGSAKTLTLGEARALAGKYWGMIEGGGDPHGGKLAERQQSKLRRDMVSEREQLGVELLWEKYMQLVASQLRSRGEKDRVFKRYILSRVRGLRVTEITKGHALEIIDALVAENKRRMADKVRQEGAAFFQWLVEREHVDRNVFAGVRKASAFKSLRTRVLSDEEVGAIWRASDPEGRWGMWIKLLILTGGCNMEVRGARWSEFDFEARVWTIPAERPMSGDQKVKDRVDKRMREALCNPGTKQPENWCLHDFRRAIATGLQRLGFRPDIADQVIGHVGSTRSGAAAHYLHHGYDDERKEALTTWSAHVLKRLEQSKG